MPFSRVIGALIIVALAPLLCAAERPTTAPAANPDRLVVRVQKIKAPPGTILADLPTTPVPANPQVLASIETLTTVGYDFAAATTVDGTTLKLAGRLRGSTDGHILLNLDFEHRWADGVTSISSSLMPERDTPKVISALAGGDSDYLLVLTLLSPARQ